MALKLKYGPKRRTTIWEVWVDGSVCCGDVRIRQGEGRSWFLYRINDDGTETPIHPMSRPQGYNRLGAAKIGAAKLGNPVERSAN